MFQVQIEKVVEMTESKTGQYQEKVDSLEQQLIQARARMGAHEARFVKIELAHRLLDEKLNAWALRTSARIDRLKDRRWWQVWK